ncbi:MAG: AmmeMemoRadiSam system protein B [Elusimicrobia bacterium]|nr:AmmeMemoRadiSam system protein B [Elusimicrobiota bacterium]
MKKYIIVLGMFTVMASCAGSSDTGNAGTRKAAVAGQFYPGNPDVLMKDVDAFLDTEVKEELGDAHIMGIIVPHAGYMYSGATAGRVFAYLKNRGYGTVILMGSSHNVYLDKPVTCSFGDWATPLGKVKEDYKLVDDIVKYTGIYINNKVFVPEHSLEVELPFLQRVLKDDFSIVPILVNEFREQKLRDYAAGISRVIGRGKGILIVMSTDMSHYFPARTAAVMDKKVSDALVRYDLESLERIMTDKSGQLCGCGAVMLGLMTLRNLGADTVVQVDYSHSGAATGDNSRVVGYGAYAVYKKEGVDEYGQEEKMGYTKEQKTELLKLARNTIQTYVKTGRTLPAVTEDKELRERRGVFVTLHKKGQLRGCIGNIFPVNELYTAVRDMAIEAAVHDPRFYPVTEDELDKIDIEISVLTVPEEVDSPDEIVMGRDGVIVKKGFRQGVYLPQVADETGWSRDEFLSSLCHSKAGLPPDAWQQKDTTLMTFQAEVFNEKELGIK